MNTRLRFSALALVGALAIAGCTWEDSVSDAAVDRTVQTENPAPEVVDVSDMNVPNSLVGLTVIDPNWITPAQYASGVYLGAKDLGEALEFTAISAAGEVLWSVERPRSCTGFAVAQTSDGRSIAVLLDIESTEDALSQNTATAYDLLTGETVWGPINVPGPYQGPGLVFASPPQDFMGESGPRVALNPDDGSVILDETSGPQILGDFSGTVLAADDGRLVAHSSSTSQQMWEIELADYQLDGQELRGFVDELAAENYALLSINSGPGPVLDLATGEVLIEWAVDIGEDPMTGALIVLDERGLHSFDAQKNLLWSQAVAEQTKLEAVGGVFAYLRSDDSVRALNVLTGAVAMAYVEGTPGPILVPAHLSPEGAGLLYDADGGLLVAAIDQMPPTGGM